MLITGLALLLPIPAQAAPTVAARGTLPSDRLHFGISNGPGTDLNWLVADSGDAAPKELSSREFALLDNYRKADDEGRAVIEKTASFAAQPKAGYKAKRSRKSS